MVNGFEVFSLKYYDLVTIKLITKISRFQVSKFCHTLVDTGIELVATNLDSE